MLHLPRQTPSDTCHFTEIIRLLRQPPETEYGALSLIHLVPERLAVAVKHSGLRSMIHSCDDRMTEKRHQLCVSYSSIARVFLLCLFATSRHVVADFDAAAMIGIANALEVELKLPWMSIDFAAELIESGTALMRNDTAIDREIVKRALFSGIVASRPMVCLSLRLIFPK